MTAERPPRRITGYHLDEEHQWVAELECGHTQHVRHEPPWQVREWTQTPEGRAGHLGTTLACASCAGSDSDDLAAFRERATEPRLKFESVVRDLKKRGKL